MQNDACGDAKHLEVKQTLHPFESPPEEPLEWMIAMEKEAKWHWGLPRLLLAILVYAGVPAAAIIIVWQNWIAVLASIALLAFVSWILFVAWQFSYYEAHRGQYYVDRN